MVLTLDPNTAASASLELLKGWKRRGDGALVVQPSSAVDSTVPRCATADHKFNALMEGRLCVLFDPEYRRAAKEPWVTVTALSPPDDDAAGAITSRKAATTTFRFTRPHPGLTLHLPLRARPSPNSHGTPKRVRHGLDVDGPNTAELCCKKRRLRAKLITSRLSQPYSQPATHILNREGQKHGDKRFLKMATSIDVAKRHANPQSASFFKYSVMNRLRQRLGLPRPGVHHEDDEDENQEPGIDTTTKAPWTTQGAQSAAGSRAQHRPHRATNLSAVRFVGAGTPPRRQSARFSKPAALPLPTSDLAATRARTSPRIHPVRSPELRPDRASYDELEEDGFAFLHIDDENNDLTDDPDHVYSDFGVIFGGGGGSGSSPSEDHSQDDDYSYEEYLDELDGISWVTM